MSAVRHILTAVGAMAATRGYATESEINQIIGGVILLIGALWGPLDEYFAARKAAPSATQTTTETTSS